ncbi:MAG: hypothetical protein SVP52_05030 [Chloroflexota bacterium]|nr:hypothetical protein [Chloroflexota bacterium]
MLKKWRIISLTGLILMTLIAACAQSTTPEPSETDTRALIIEKCSDCHSTDRVFEGDYTQEEWSEIFDDMIQKGAGVSPEEKPIMIDWLVSQD